MSYELVTKTSALQDLFAEVDKHLWYKRCVDSLSFKVYTLFVLELQFYDNTIDVALKREILRLIDDVEIFKLERSRGIDDGFQPLQRRSR